MNVSIHSHLRFSRNAVLEIRALIGCCEVDELAPMVPARHKMSSAYIDEYVRHFPVSEPVEDFEGRLELYCL